MDTRLNNKFNLLAYNAFHNTATSVQALGTYESQAGGMIAVVSERELDRAGRDLCGMPDCKCGKGPHLLTDNDGNVYHIAVRAL